MSGVTVANPLFVDDAGRDFRLAEGSPAGNAGTLTNAPAMNIAGVDRPQGSGVDVGAYEPVTASGGTGTAEPVPPGSRGIDGGLDD